jgi:hypothetical protein
MLSAISRRLVMSSFLRQKTVTESYFSWLFSISASRAPASRDLLLRNGMLIIFVALILCLLPALVTGNPGFAWGRVWYSRRNSRRRPKAFRPSRWSAHAAWWNSGSGGRQARVDEAS